MPAQSGDVRSPGFLVTGITYRVVTSIAVPAPGRSSFPLLISKDIS